MRRLAKQVRGDGTYERDQWPGTMEVDETLVGGAEHGGKRGRGAYIDRVIASFRHLFRLDS